MTFHTPRNTSALAGMLSVFLTVLTLSCLSAQAQDMNAYSSGRGPDMSNRSPASMGVPSYQDTIEFLTQKARQEERERVAEENRRQLGTSMERLHSEIAVLTDWRGQLRKHQKQVAMLAWLVDVLRVLMAAAGSWIVARLHSDREARLDLHTISARASELSQHLLDVVVSLLHAHSVLQAA